MDQGEHDVTAWFLTVGDLDAVGDLLGFDLERIGGLCVNQRIAAADAAVAPWTTIAVGDARSAHRRAEIHQRIGVGDRIMWIDLGGNVRPHTVTIDWQRQAVTSGIDARNVGVDHRHHAGKGEHRHRPGGVRSDARQLTQAVRRIRPHAATCENRLTGTAQAFDP